jgi:hypothetical protein
MILRLTTIYENGKPPLSPLGERVAHDGVFISRRGPGEGVPGIFMHGGEPQDHQVFTQNDTAGRFFHTLRAFPQVRRQSRFGAIPFEDSDATLPYAR